MKRAITGAVVLAAGLGLLAPTVSSAATAPPTDPAFGTSGRVVDFATGNVDIAASARDGLFTVIAGSIDNGVRDGVFLARYGATGHLDPSFGVGGVVKDFTVATDSYASAMKIDSAGRIVVAGTASNGSREGA